MNSEIMRRNRPGTKAADLYSWAPEDFSKMKGLFAVQEYIQELIRDNPSDIQKIITLPAEVDIGNWKYEHLRQFILETNLLIVQLQGICTKQSCPKMKATDDWLYLCAVHKETLECSAIDYMIHNLDQMTSILNNSKLFANRLQIKGSSLKNFDSIVRRLYRFFSHTYFHHKDIFQDFEREMHLFERFTSFAKKYDMISLKYIIIPDDAFSQK